MNIHGYAHLEDTAGIFVVSPFFQYGLGKLSLLARPIATVELVISLILYSLILYIRLIILSYMPSSN